LNEQRRAINEQKGAQKDEITIQNGQGPIPKALTKEEIMQNDEQKEEGEEHFSGEMMESSTSAKMGMPMPSLVGAKVQIPNENPMQNPWQKINSTEEDGADEGNKKGERNDDGMPSIGNGQEGTKENVAEDQPEEVVQ
jgi:hypothetical protein